jgi:hypothetical protein
MRCDEAAEFVSALSDGETIPRSAAEHVGTCPNCQNLLKDYMGIGAELRRVASLNLPDEVRPRVWDKRPGALMKWWQRGRESMRIPRFAFVAMLAGIVALGSGLAVVSVRAHTDGKVVLLKISPSAGQYDTCPLSAVDKKWQVCSSLRPMNSNTGMLRYQVNLLTSDGDRIQLGVRAKYYVMEPGFTENIENLPQQQYWFEPGETLHLDVAGFGTMAVTGEWTDHMPSLIAENHDLDPGPEELRMISPLLLRGKEVVGDFEGANIIADKSGQGVVIYLPNQGRFEVSLSPFPGAIQGAAKLNRISFELNGESYVFLTGAPVTRSEQVWVSRIADFKPSGEFSGSHGSYIGTLDLSQQPPDQAKH